MYLNIMIVLNGREFYLDGYNIKGETLSNIFNNCIKKINNFIKD